MKKAFSILIMFLIILLIPIISVAANKTVTIEWSIQDTSGVNEYKLYYSYDMNMYNKELAYTETNVEANSLTCSINIEAYPVFFTIAAVTTNGEIESTVKEVNHTITQVQNFTVLNAVAQ
ncbi:MAG: hypothetical protein DRP58_00695 [Spirochaetes bacterium]|nr:MAG: hypothetical protein DRP58_00695 [Spirochaetota bacterium]